MVSLTLVWIVYVTELQFRVPKEKMTVMVCATYGSIALFTSIIHNVFLLYHVETFLSVYRIDKFSFWTGEIIFLLWNSLNDPLFAWLSDRGYLGKGGKTTTLHDVILKRIQALSRSGPLLAVSFLLIWFSWAYPGVQFVVCLCLYDGFLTVVDLQHSALLADLAVSVHDRAKLNSYSSACSAVGAISVFLSYLFWNRERFISFQLFCSVLAAFSLVGYFLSTAGLKRQYLQENVYIEDSHRNEDLLNR